MHDDGSSSLQTHGLAEASEISAGKSQDEQQQPYTAEEKSGRVIERSPRTFLNVTSTPLASASSDGPPFTYGDSVQQPATCDWKKTNSVIKCHACARTVLCRKFRQCTACGYQFWMCERCWSAGGNYELRFPDNHQGPLPLIRPAAIPPEGPVSPGGDGPLDNAALSDAAVGALSPVEGTASDQQDDRILRINFFVRQELAVDPFCAFAEIHRSRNMSWLKLFDVPKDSADGEECFIPQSNDRELATRVGWPKLEAASLGLEDGFARPATQLVLRSDHLSSNTKPCKRSDADIKCAGLRSIKQSTNGETCVSTCRTSRSKSSCGPTLQDSSNDTKTSINWNEFIDDSKALQSQRRLAALQRTDSAIDMTYNLDVLSHSATTGLIAVPSVDTEDRTVTSEMTESSPAMGVRSFATAAEVAPLAMYGCRFSGSDCVRHPAQNMSTKLPRHQPSDEGLATGDASVSPSSSRLMTKMRHDCCTAGTPDVEQSGVPDGKAMTLVQRLRKMFRSLQPLHRRAKK